MNYRKLSLTAYLTVLLICIYACGDYIIQNNPNEYKKTLKTIEYQMGYSEVYSDNITYGDVPFEVVGDAPEDVKNDVLAEKVVYLTFDDGPSSRTVEVLDILKEYDVKATFFVVCSQKKEDAKILKRIFDEGHTIGVHTASHSYKQIYKSVDNYLKDFETCFNYILQETGQAPSIFRFPGGSVNNYNKSIRKDLAAEMLRRGFKYFDWNVSGGDAEKSYSASSIHKNVISGCTKRQNSVVLMHDSVGKKQTVDALRDIIPQLLKDGYIFKPLDETAKPVIFKLN